MRARFSTLAILLLATSSCSKEEKKAGKRLVRPHVATSEPAMTRPSGVQVVVDEALRVEESWLEDSSGARFEGDQVVIQRETLPDGKVRVAVTPRGDRAADAVTLLLSRDAFGGPKVAVQVEPAAGATASPSRSTVESLRGVVRLASREFAADKPIAFELELEGARAEGTQPARTVILRAAIQAR